MGKTVVRSAIVLSMRQPDRGEHPVAQNVSDQQPGGAAVDNAHVGNVDSRFVSAIKLNTNLADIDINAA
jgi:hypothetical protein